LNDSLVIIIH